MKKESSKKDNPVKPAVKLFTQDAIKSVVESIELNNGSEIFFLGVLNSDGIVNYVEPLAYGNKNAVPVVSSAAKPGNVIIHNHPNGVMEPSDADISVSGNFADLGVGSYIIDNLCEKVRIVVKAIPPPEKELLNLEKVKKILGAKGSISKEIDDYEFREEQISMLEKCAEAFNNDLISLIEAGTGVGKSLAYLIPAIFWAVKNKERIIISTNTINLQEQLLYKDIPLLEKSLNNPFKSVLIKGRSNYLCLRKLELAKTNTLQIYDEKNINTLEVILEWAENTKDGTKSDLGFIPEDNVWEMIQAEAESCPRLKCPHYEKCFFYLARRTAAKADIVIANHHLVMADLAIRLETQNYSATSVLPPSKRIIFDEAHNLEDVGTSYFSIQVTKLGLERMLLKFFSRKAEKTGLLPCFENLLNIFLSKIPNNAALKDIHDFLYNNIYPLCENIYVSIGMEWANMIYSFTDFCQSEKKFDEGDSIKLRVTDKMLETEFWQIEIKDRLIKLSKSLLNFISETDSLLKKVANLPQYIRDKIWNISIEIRGFLIKMEVAASKIISFINLEKGYCRWFDYSPSRRGREPILRCCAGPIYLSENMKKAVFDVNSSIILTSATLTVNNSFSYLKKQIGLDEYSPWESKKKQEAAADEKADSQKIKYISEIKLDSPFDYKNNVIIAIPHDLPEPSEKDFTDYISDLIVQACEYSKGGSLILFTSYVMMNKVYDQTKETLNSLGIKTFLQGQEQRHILLKNFRKNISSVLFATASFWEGVDVKGESLHLLILVRLPFRVPSEPILLARAEEIQKQGGDPFMEMDLPAAVTKFRQGFGRLIRSKTDRGAVLVFDKRIITKNYGKSFLNSIPKCNILSSDSEDVIECIKKFFS